MNVINTGKSFFSDKNNKLLWLILLIAFGLIGVITFFMRVPGFWTSYGLNLLGPAWVYILIRCQYRSKDATFFSIKFSPEGATAFIFGMSIIVETTQYLEIYPSQFDPWDYLAYFGGVLFIYLLEKAVLTLSKKR